ncbi:Cys-tRNA(Pro)/Cys-tRNA(Cys) deacylase [Mycolicibacterium rutilum]|uniref:Cys-tRNA(Pro)/Cys-tRNA(Cys) deacylase n=1 Tax=Mycolicibacterium rutilum TaxID=370526 RepID=A0A1H6LVH8_MYCRU|nr:Cys-tRNA(Pro)/Cys-tRNA(Cys) deacylase [Mycolicibacterium rutilum]
MAATTVNNTAIGPGCSPITDASGAHYSGAVPRAATPAIAALLSAGVPHEVLQYHHDPRAESFGEEAVEALARDTGIEPAQVFKTLVVALPRGLGVAVLPVPARLSLKAAAAALGVPKVTMTEKAAAERSTGYVLGGISPLGQRKPLPTVVDESALQWDRVLCSAGKRGWDVAVAPQDLVRLTGAATADICA